MRILCSGLVIGLLIILSGFFGCVSKPVASRPGALTVMTYNVENLFDTLDDPQIQDETYLPKAAKQTARHRNLCQGIPQPHYREECLNLDWSDTLLERKMQRLADVILQLKDGQGPDILILQEVENLAVLERLRLNHLQAAKYQPAILLEGSDERGIDVGILTRLPLAAAPRLHRLDLDKVAKAAGRRTPAHTRGILQADLQLSKDKVVTVLGVHFPSQGSPSSYRQTAIDTLLQIKKQLPAEAWVIVGGDFNITAREDREQGFLSRTVNKEFLVSHQVGCQSCEGTHNYRGSWSFLDVLLFSYPFQRGAWRLDAASIRIPNQSLYQTNHWGAPARFSEGRGQKGVSDHWPLAAEIYPVAQP